MNIFYWIKGWQLLKGFDTDVQNELSYEPQTSFLRNFLIITGICLLVWTGLLLTSFFGFDMLERDPGIPVARGVPHGSVSGVLLRVACCVLGVA